VTQAFERGRSNRFARQLFAELPARYDALAEVLSFGQNGRWRRRLVDAITDSGPARVLDVATGTAGVARAIADRSGATVTGVDLTLPMLRRGADNLARRPARAPVHLLVGTGERLPFPDASFDAVSFTYLLRYVPDPLATLAELARVLRPGGCLASLDFAVPPNPVAYVAWRAYTALVLPAAGWLTGGRPWWDVGRFLGPSIRDHYRNYPIPWHESAWRRAGLTDVHIAPMSLGGGLVMWATNDRA
jgi:demethylmenaquinone methyltransferase/2-methoxy-6-polyprenyl-1,4-benzoquinol methylase